MGNANHFIRFILTTTLFINPISDLSFASQIATPRSPNVIPFQSEALTLSMITGRRTILPHHPNVGGVAKTLGVGGNLQAEYLQTSKRWKQLWISVLKAPHIEEHPAVQDIKTLFSSIPAKSARHAFEELDLTHPQLRDVIQKGIRRVIAAHPKILQKFDGHVIERRAEPGYHAELERLTTRTLESMIRTYANVLTFSRSAWLASIAAHYMGWRIHAWHNLQVELRGGILATATGTINFRQLIFLDRPWSGLLHGGNLEIVSINYDSNGSIDEVQAAIAYWERQASDNPNNQVLRQIFNSLNSAVKRNRIHFFDEMRWSETEYLNAFTFEGGLYLGRGFFARDDQTGKPAFDETQRAYLLAYLALELLEIEDNLVTLKIISREEHQSFEKRIAEFIRLEDPIDLESALARHPLLTTQEQPLFTLYFLANWLTMSIGYWIGAKETVDIFGLAHNAGHIATTYLRYHTRHHRNPNTTYPTEERLTDLFKDDVTAHHPYLYSLLAPLLAFALARYQFFESLQHFLEDERDPEVMRAIESARQKSTVRVTEKGGLARTNANVGLLNQLLDWHDITFSFRNTLATGLSYSSLENRFNEQQDLSVTALTVSPGWLTHQFARFLSDAEDPLIPVPGLGPVCRSTIMFVFAALGGQPWEGWHTLPNWREAEKEAVGLVHEDNNPIVSKPGVTLRLIDSIPIASGPLPSTPQLQAFRSDNTVEITFYKQGLALQIFNYLYELSALPQARVSLLVRW